MNQIVQKAREILDAKKAEDINVIDMTQKEYISEWVVIATTLTGRHGLSLIDDLKEGLKPLGAQFLHVEEGDDWMVVDLGDIIIHLMSESYRAKYNIAQLLEELKKDLKK